MLRVVSRIPNKKVQWRTQQVPEFKLYHSVNYHTNKIILRPLSPIRQYSSQHSNKSGGGGGGGTIVALSAIVLAGGATLGYAKYDPDFRKVLTAYIPYTDNVLKTLFVEEGTGNIFSNSYNNAKSTIAKAIFGGKSVKVVDVPEPTEYKAPPPIVPVIEKDVKKIEPTYSEIRLEQREKGNEEPKVEIAGQAKPISLQAGYDSTNLYELEDKIGKSAEEAVNAYNKAVYILKTYNQDIEYIIDEAVNDIKPDTWETIRNKTRSKAECIRRAELKADEATKDIDKLNHIVASPTFDAPRNTKDMILTNISKVYDDIKKARNELEAEQKRGSVTEKYWAKVEKARQHFSTELESLFPLIDLSKKELRVKEEDIDLFVLHTYANVLFYQKELAKMETIIQDRIKSAVEAAKKGGLEPLTNAQICEALEQEKRRLIICFQQQVLKLKKDAETELRDQLKRQSQIFSDHLNDAINTRVMEIERALTRKYDELLESERCQYKTQLSAVVGRLRGLENSLKDKKHSDEVSKKAQVLWSACQSLLRAIRAGCPGMAWKDQIRPLEPEISAVKNAAAASDELVSVVISGIPKEAKERGVYPEDALRERFLKVEQVARTVALVPEEGAALPIHILSFFQSMLLIKAASPIPQSELNDEKVNFDKLNTNDILQRARYWMDRGDFAQTLRYMNLLKGAPRCVARQWMNETRILLETQQAANTLMAHAASSGLVFL